MGQHGPLQRADRTTGDSNSRILRSENVTVASTKKSAHVNAAQESDSRVRESGPKVGMNQPQLRYTTRSGNTVTNAKSTATSKTLSEDFIGEDDEEGLLEALDQANAAKAGPQASRKHRTPLSNESQQSDAPKAENPQRRIVGQSNRSKRKVTPLLGPEEEFMQLCDEDEVEFIELTDNVEEKAVQRSPTPPLHNNKLNLREVNPHEDYGGALLSDTDRQLLGMLDAILASFAALHSPFCSQAPLNRKLTPLSS